MTRILVVGLTCLVGCASSGQTCPEVVAPTLARPARPPPRASGSQSALCAELAGLGEAREALRAARGDATVLAYAAAFPGAEEVALTAREAGALRAEPMLVLEAHVFAPRRIHRLAIQGRTASSLEAMRSYVTAGDIGLVARGGQRVVLGTELAESLGVSVGDTLGLVPMADESGGALHGPRVDVEVAALLRFPGDALSALGQSEIVVELGVAQRMGAAISGQDAMVSGIAVTFESAERAQTGLTALRAALEGQPYRVVPLAELVQSMGVTEGALRVFCGVDRPSPPVAPLDVSRDNP